MLKIFSNKPWLPVALLLAAFLAAWACFITIAINHQPAPVAVKATGSVP